MMIGAGILLMLKKEVVWIQPETVRGEQTGVPPLSINQLFEAARSVPEASDWRWNELERVDFKPGKGVVKFVGPNNYEIQVDTHSGEILQVAYRRSDVIESLHDGSFFSDDTKLFLFLPAGIILFILWGTGIYLFFLPRMKKRQKKIASREQKNIAHKGVRQPAE